MKYVTPPFLRNKSVDEVHNQMIMNLPADLDVSEGSHEWNMTRPSAIGLARMYQFILPEVIRLIFPSWSYGEYLDAHARNCGLYRRPATYAVGLLDIAGKANTVIPAGSRFSTASTNSESSVDYETLEETLIPAEGKVEIKVRCVKAGTAGNTAENTVVFVSSGLRGIDSVTNPMAITGGTERESDASLITRVEEYAASQGESFVGNPSDYKRWAKSVPGVGEVLVIPAEDDSGLVTLIITDANGAPATKELCEAVYNYIMRPDEPDLRLTHPNARLVVEAPATLDLCVQATVELMHGYQLDVVTAAFKEALEKQYLAVAMEEKEIKYTRIARVLSGISGVNDYTDLKIGVSGDGAVVYDTKNIPIGKTELPTMALSNLALSSGVV